MTSVSRSGTQSIERAVSILRALATRGDFGWRLLDLSAHCGIGRATTHRILATLIRERLAEQRTTDRRYVPGPLLFDLGLSLRSYAAFQAACNAPLVHIVRRLGDLAYVCLRSGVDFVCAARVGKRVAATVEVGARGPLITAVGGVAILVALPKEEAGPIIGENLRQLTRFGETRIRALRTVLRHSEAKGFGLSQGIIVPGVGACGVPIRDKKGVPFASINVVGPLERFTTAAIPQLVLQLQEQASALEREAARVFKPKRP